MGCVKAWPRMSPRGSFEWFITPFPVRAMYPFLAKFFEPRGIPQTQERRLGAATQTFTETRESPDQDEPVRRPSSIVAATLGTSTFTLTREDPDSDPSRELTVSMASLDVLGTETFTRTREDPDTDPGVTYQTATQTMTKTSGESADTDATTGTTWLEAALL